MPNYDVDDEFELPAFKSSAANPNFDERSVRSAATYNPKEIDWGTAAPAPQGDGLERIAAKKGETIRFACVPGYKPLFDEVHFIGVNGRPARFYIHPEEDCPACALGDYPKGTVVILIVQYTNADPDGGLARDAIPTYKIGFISISRKHFDTLRKSVEEGSTPYDVDYIMHSDGDRYEFSVKAAKARHVVRADTAKILELAKPLAPLLKNKLGSPMPPNAKIALAPKRV